MDDRKIAGDILRLAECLVGKAVVSVDSDMTIGGVDFKAVRKRNPKGVFWVYRVGSKEFDQAYGTRAKMWDDLMWMFKAVGDVDRWRGQFD